jgi:hypothetical protein
MEQILSHVESGSISQLSRYLIAELILLISSKDWKSEKGSQRDSLPCNFGNLPFFVLQ